MGPELPLVDTVLTVERLTLSFAGLVAVGGGEITPPPPHVRARLGIGRTFQNIALYPAMSALANIMSGRLIHMRSGVLAGGLYWGPAERGGARAMAPGRLLLDEPMAGMSAEEKADMARYILELREVRGLPMILIEHDMGVIMDLCDRLICMDYGKKIAEGPPQEIQHHSDVIRAYLGEDHAVVGGGGRGGGEEA